MKISEKVGIYRKFSGKIGQTKFLCIFFSRLTEKRYFGEKSEIFVPGRNQGLNNLYTKDTLVIK